MACQATSTRGGGFERVVSHPPRPFTERRLLQRYHDEGDIAARDEVIERFLPLARRLALRYHRPGQPLDDLTQVAALGLIKAIDRYEPDRGTTFPTYAVPNILGELRRHFRDTGWAVHVPRSVQDRVLQVDAATSRLSKKLGRAPTAAELAKDLGQPAEQIVEAIDAASAHTALSLDTPRGDDDEDGDTRGDALGTPDPGYELVEDVAAIGPALRALPARERLVLKLRFSDDLTQTEIAERIGVSQMHVSRIIRRSLARMQKIAHGVSRGASAG